MNRATEMDVQLVLIRNNVIDTTIGKLLSSLPFLIGMDAMSYKKLNIDRSHIKEALTIEGTTISGPEVKGNETLFTVHENGIRIALLAFYFNKDGTTSIAAKGNTNEIEKGLELSELVKTTCLYSDRESVSLSLRMSKQDFDDSIEYLIQECAAENIEEKAINGGTQYKLSGASGDKLIIKYFTRRMTIQVQGKPLALYDDLLKLLCELLPYEDVVKSQLAQIKVNIDPSVIRSELESNLPNAFVFLTERVRSIISPALALSHLNIALDDYSSFVMPVLRGMEGYLKLLFSNKNITIGNNFGDRIHGGDSCSVLPDTKIELNCSKTVVAIERCYDYWSSQRHGLFHVDSSTETTRILDRDEADKILRKALNLIDETYANIIS